MEEVADVVVSHLLGCQSYPQDRIQPLARSFGKDQGQCTSLCRERPTICLKCRQQASRIDMCPPSCGVKFPSSR